MKETPRFEGAGLSEIITNNSPTPLDLEHQDRIDPRLAFFACASARLTLIEEGCLSLDQAFDRGFVEKFRELGRLTCWCERRIKENFDHLYRHDREQRLAQWRRSQP